MEADRQKLQTMLRNKYVDLDEYYSKFNLDNLFLEIRNELYQKCDELMKKRKKQKKSTVEYEKLSDKDFIEKYKKMIRKVEKKVEDNQLK